MTADNLAAVIARFAALRDAWRELPPGDALEMRFPSSDASEGGK
jgi:hypothetical protein